MNTNALKTLLQPQILRRLKTYQGKGIEFMVNNVMVNEHGCILAHSMGEFQNRLKDFYIKTKTLFYNRSWQNTSVYFIVRYFSQKVSLRSIHNASVYRTPLL